MAQELPDWLISFLGERGLFSDRYATAPEKTEDIKSNITFEQVLRDVLESGGDYQGSFPSPSSGKTLSPLSVTTPSSSLGTTDKSKVSLTEPGLFERVVNEVVDTVGNIFSPTSTEKENKESEKKGLFDFELPGFLGDMTKQSMTSVSKDIARNTNYSTQDRIGGMLSLALSSLIPTPLSLFGMAMNAAGGSSFDPEKHTNLTIDPLTGIAKYDQREYTEQEPTVPSWERLELFDTLTNLMEVPDVKIGINEPTLANIMGEKIGLMGMPGITPNTKYDLYEFFDQYTATPEQQALASLTSTDLETLQESAAEGLGSPEGTEGFGSMDDSGGVGLGY
jgi:hypothetical protein